MPSPITILNVGHHYHIRAGSDRYMLTLGELLRSRGHRVIPFAAAHPGNRATPFSEFFPPRVRVEAPRPVDALRYVYSRPARAGLRRLLAAHRVDVAHLHIYYGQLTSSILGVLRRAGVPVVQTLHEYKLACPVHTFVSGGQICEACQGRYRRALPRRCNRGSALRTGLTVLESTVSRALGGGISHFVSPSRFLRRKMIDHGAVASERITAIPHPAELPEPLKPPDGTGLVLYFGRLAPVKGIRTLLKAAARLRGGRVVLAGRGPLGSEIAAGIAAGRLRNVTLAGFRDGAALRDLLGRSLCTVLPSEWYENFPMSVLESMAAGRPVVGSDIGGIPELITHNVDGLLVPPGRPELLAARLQWMIDHPDDAARMGAAARERLARDFGSARHYDRVMAIYDRVLSAAA